MALREFPRIADVVLSDPVVWRNPVVNVFAHSFLHILIYSTNPGSGNVNLCIRVLISDFPGGSDGKESAYNARDPGSIPGSGRSLEEGNGYPLQQPCLENSMDRDSSLGLVNFKSSSQGIRMKKEN